jgi:hypothetical protein
MIRSLDLRVVVVSRWLVLALTAVASPGLMPVGIGALWVLVLGQEGKAGLGLAAGMSLAAATVNLILYALW